jgi:hypothetical protein
MKKYSLDDLSKMTRREAVSLLLPFGYSQTYLDNSYDDEIFAMLHDELDKRNLVQ